MTRSRYSRASSAKRRLGAGHWCVWLLVLGLVSISSLSYARVPLGASRRSPVVEAVERVSSAVVSVRTQRAVAEHRGGGLFDWFFRDFSPPRGGRVETVSQGSGVIIDSRGYVLTNYHVVAVGGAIELELSDGRTLGADIVGTSPEHDLAVLRAETDKKLPHVPMGRSDELMIGETVIAIGNPFGLSHTVTVGVISAVHRTINADDRTYSDFIQTDASINPGNSGGPLLTIDGSLVGVNTAIYGKAQGIGFAIPIDKARRIVSDLVAFGEVRRPYFGFEVQKLTPTLAEAFGLSQSAGVLVAQVDSKGPARKVLREGDVLVEVGGIKVEGIDAVRLRMGDYTVGARVPLGVLRERRAIDVTLKPVELDPADALRRLKARIGIDVQELPFDQAQRWGLPRGTIVVAQVLRNSAAGRAGLSQGDLIRAINSERVVGLLAFGKGMARHYWRGRVVLLVQRGRVLQQVAFDY